MQLHHVGQMPLLNLCKLNIIRLHLYATDSKRNYFVIYLFLPEENRTVCPKQLILINSWVLATIRTLRYIRYEPGTAA